MIMKSINEYKNQAIEALDGNWGDAAVLMLICFVVNIAASLLSDLSASTMTLMGVPFGLYTSTPLSLLLAIVLTPMSWGLYVAFLNKARGNSIDNSYLTKGYGDFSRIAFTIVLSNIYIALWSLLLFIPGIIKYYSYSMTPFILNDDPELSYNAAIEKSMEMMSGHKMDLFLLDLSFIGWAILCLLTLGIGFLWLYPYMYTAKACFYEDLKKEMTNDFEEVK